MAVLAHRIAFRNLHPCGRDAVWSISQSVRLTTLSTKSTTLYETAVSFDGLLHVVAGTPPVRHSTAAVILGSEPN
jgi:hypothetical protein